MIAGLLGRFLRGVRAGEEKLLWKHPDIRNVPDTLMLSSSGFQDGGVMPVPCAARRIGGEDQSPSLTWSNLPPNTVELVVVMEDPDAPLPVTALESNVVVVLSPQLMVPEKSLVGAFRLASVKVALKLVGVTGAFLLLHFHVGRGHWRGCGWSASYFRRSDQYLILI